MPVSASTTFTNLKLEPFMSPELAREQTVALGPSLDLARGTVLGEVTPVQTVTISGSPTGGTFTLTCSGVTTAPIAWNATSAAVQAALSALGVLNAVAVSGSAGGPWPVTLYPPANTLFPTLSASGAGLTGGTSPAAGVAWASPGYTSWGIYRSYAAGNTDGSQVAKCLLAYDAQTDAAGNITLSAFTLQAGGEWGETCLGTAAWFSGVFRCEELSGLDATAITALGASLIEGTVTQGIVRL